MRGRSSDRLSRVVLAAAVGAALCVAAQDEAPAAECGEASNCGGLGGWRLILLADDPPPRLPDLLVEHPSVVDTTLTTEQAFTLRVTVRNDGRGGADTATLYWYRSADRAISDADEQVGSTAVAALDRGDDDTYQIELRTPSQAATHYYGACVDADDDDASNDCSAAVAVAVETRTAFFGAIATSVASNGCFAGGADSMASGAAATITDADMQAARDGALAECRRQGGTRCRVTDTWVRGCAGLAIGIDRTAGRCGAFHYGGTSAVTALSQAKRGALSACREAFSECLDIGHCDDGTFGAPPGIGGGIGLSY